jgi:RimJ/RimL family protein N-acetyltransferase
MGKKFLQRLSSRMMIRRANLTDALDVFAWRNDPVTRQMFVNGDEVSLADHLAWYNAVIESKGNILYIGIIGQVKIGVCRFDYDSKRKSSEVSINLNPSVRGKGLSFELLSECMNNYCQSNKLILTAKIKTYNEASLSIFIKKGFEVIYTDLKYYYLCYNST